MITQEEIHNLHQSSRTNNMVLNIVYEGRQTLQNGEMLGDSPSHDIGHAWELMNVMVNRGYRPRIIRVAEGEWACSMGLNEPTAYDSLAPLAICKAVLLTLVK